MGGVSSGMLHALLLLSAALSLPSQGAMAKPDQGYLSGKQHLFQPYLGPTGHSFGYGGQLLGLYSKLLKPGLQRYLQYRRNQRNTTKANTPKWKFGKRGGTGRLGRLRFGKKSVTEC